MAAPSRGPAVTLLSANRSRKPSSMPEVGSRAGPTPAASGLLCQYFAGRPQFDIATIPPDSEAWVTAEAPLVTVLLRQWRDGDEAALDRLMPLVHDALHRLAHQYVNRERRGHTPTVHRGRTARRTADPPRPRIARRRGRLFDRVDPKHIEVENTRVIDSPRVTHLRYRVVKED